MDIPELSMAMSASALQTQVSTAVLDKTLDLTEDLGMSMVGLIDQAVMETSVNPNVGANLDISIEVFSPERFCGFLMAFFS